MKHYPKIIFGIFLILLIIALSRNSNINNSIATLTSFENKFSLNFSLIQSDKESFSKFLNNIDLSSVIIDGVEFELDKRSTAALSSVTPVNINIDIKDDQISFSGDIENITLESFQFDPMDIPDSTNLYIASRTLNSLVSEKLNIPAELAKWINDASLGPGQIVFFDDTPQWVYRTQTEDINLDSLKEIANGLGIENSYKNEEFDELELHLIKIAQNQDETVAIFLSRDYLYVASSRLSAEEIINAQNQPQNFFRNSEEISFFLYFQNKNSYPVSENLVRFFSGNKPSLENSITKIKSLSFSLKSDSFSGLINVK